MLFALTTIRHGESLANVERMLSGWKDVPLTENGIASLHKLRASFDYPSADSYYSSPMARCRETFRILYPSIEPIIDPRLKELNFRSLEGTILESKEAVDRYFSTWVQGIQRSDEESMEEASRRALSSFSAIVLEEAAKGNRSAVFLTHSGIMRVFIIAMFSLRKEEFLRMHVRNGLGYSIQLDIQGNKIIPVSYKELSPGLPE